MSSIKSIKNIELSSICNMSCEYCLSSHIKEHRKPGFMSLETFEKVVDRIVEFEKQGTQGEVWLHGTGESLLNKDLIAMIKLIKSKIDLPVYLSSNGLLIDRDMASKLKESGINKIDISFHDENVAKQALLALRLSGIPSVITTGSQEARFNWAGQIEVEDLNQSNPGCEWIKNQECFVLHDGSIVNCCFDSFGTNIIGHIDDMSAMQIKPFELCKSCNHLTGDSQ